MVAKGLADFLLQKVELFQEFSADQLEELVAGSRCVTFEANEAIVEVGSEGHFLGVLVAGEAEVLLVDDGGRRRQVNILRRGGIFGEMALMTGSLAVANVVGLVPGKALLIPQPLFASKVLTQPGAITFLSRMIMARTRHLSVDESQRMHDSALQRSADPYGFDLLTDSPMKLLVINCGSSSLKYNLFNTADDSGNMRGTIERIGEDGTQHRFTGPAGDAAKELPTAGHAEAFASMIEALTNRITGVLKSASEVDAVGHRVVHGGELYSQPTIINDEVLQDLEQLSPLAPLHNPVNVLGIQEASKLFARALQVAVFDTAFHQTMPPYAYLYGLPYEQYEKHQIRRYGFHGTSHAYVALKAAQFLKRPFGSLEIITCHLGNGASVCAIDHGRSIDTSMGMTPAEGLLMGTRCGDIDPAVLTHLMRTQGLDSATLDSMVNKESGLKGISGLSNDMREVQKAAKEGDLRALHAYRVFCYRLRKYIGAYAAAMGGVDAVVFTGGIGQGSAGVRSLACQGLDYMGLQVDEERNLAARNAATWHEISAANSAVKVLVVPTDEERMIAREMLRALSGKQINEVIKQREPTPVPLEVSAHHVHLSQEHVEALFGKGHRLTEAQELSQPGQFACEERVHLIGPRGRVDNVRVLGPTRESTQVEISMTEQFKLGIQAPIRASGDITDTPGLTLEGTTGQVVLEQGVICALRHIHMAPADALSFGVRDRDVVQVRTTTDRELIFGDVLVRVHPEYRLAMHIDTDEANASNVRTGDMGYIGKIQRAT